MSKLSIVLYTILGVSLLPGRVWAADMQYIDVQYEDDQYHLISLTRLDVTVDELYQTLTNYDQFDQFTSAVVEAYNFEIEDSEFPGQYTRMEGCVVFFCKQFERRGHLELTPPNVIVAIADPEHSDFKVSRERWQITPTEDGVLLVYEFTMVPDFWVPPAIGPYLIKRSLRKDGEEAIQRIEIIAQGGEPDF